MMSVLAISMEKCFGGFDGVCCSKFGNFIPFEEVCEQVMHDGSKLLDIYCTIFTNTKHIRSYNV